MRGKTSVARERDKVHTNRPPTANGVASRQRGMALLLVVIAVAVASVLSTAFLAAQSTSTAVAQNVEHHAHARFIAESGLVTAIEYARSDPDWRSDRDEGEWVSNHSFEGGAFSIVAYDGEDADGNGQYSGDGEFTSDPTEPITLIATGTFNGTTSSATAVLRPRGGVPGVTGIAVATEVNFGNNGLIDSYDSTQGPYHKDNNASSNAVIATNSVDSDMLVMGNNGELAGSAYVGPGGNPDSGIDIGDVSGEKDALTEPVDLPGCSPPDVGSSDGDMDLGDHETWTVYGDVKWDNFDAGNGVTLYIHGDVTIHVTGDFDTGNNFRLILDPGATLDLYVDGDLDFGNNAEINYDSSRTHDMTVHNCGDGDIDFGNNARIAGTIISPNAEMETGNNAHFYGMFLGYELDFGNNVLFHQDLSLLGPDGGGGGGASGYDVIWQ